MPIRLDGDLPQTTLSREADDAMARSEKTVQRMQLMSSGQMKKWMLAFFGVFVLGTLGAFIFILQKDLGVLSRAAESGVPDLIVSDPVLVAEEGVGNVPLSLAGSIANQGVNGAREFNYTFEIDLNGQGSVFTPDIVFSGSPKYLNIRPNMSKQVSGMWSYPTAGVHQIRLCADVNNVVIESDELNNCGPAAWISIDTLKNTVCSDGQDNDNDGLIDYPSDQGCVSASDNDEADAISPPQISDVSVCPWQGPGAAIRGKCADPSGCSLDVYQSDLAKVWGAVRCANNAAPCTAGQDCESPVQADGLTYTALLTDQNGLMVRYNKAAVYSSVAIVHPGGGGAGKWLDDRTDYPNDQTDWPGLQNNYGMRVVGVKWATTGVECGASECGRWLPKTDAPTDFAALAVRPDAVFRWIEDNLNPDHKPLALLGSSGGAHAILSPAMVGSSLMNKVKYMAIVSLAPLTDYYYACTNFTPANLYIDQATGAYTNNPKNAGAALNQETGGSGPKKLPDDVWNIGKGQAGCMNQFNLTKPFPSQPPSAIAALTSPSNVSDILNMRVQSGDAGYTGAADFIVNTLSGSDDTCGCTWAEGRMFNHAYFANTKKTWKECSALAHGGALSQPDKACFDWIYDGLIDNLINPQ